MRNAIISALVLSFFLLGCTQDNTPTINPFAPTTQVELNVSPITIIEDRELIVYNPYIAPNITNTTNKTVPDYTFEPEKDLFIFFINATVAPNVAYEVLNEYQGESILIKKGDADILIDSGVETTSTFLVNFLKNKGVDDIELYVSTHARPTNYGGMQAVFDNFEVEQFLWNN
ncbi:hypothetical protein KJ780_00735, partial [Candidatus Micrarchaeota archaeon]|nr:hypothetical protein [Candidatus Micrarchaeota archaeon]